MVAYISGKLISLIPLSKIIGLFTMVFKIYFLLAKGFILLSFSQRP
jgi:energy-converting hydrogenase Eha subunit H